MLGTLPAPYVVSLALRKGLKISLQMEGREVATLPIGWHLCLGPGQDRNWVGPIYMIKHSHHDTHTQRLTHGHFPLQTIFKKCWKEGRPPVPGGDKKPIHNFSICKHPLKLSSYWSRNLDGFLGQPQIPSPALLPRPLPSIPPKSCYERSLHSFPQIEKKLICGSRWTRERR